MRSGLAESTRRGYQRGLGAYRHFLRATGQEAYENWVVRPSEMQMANFIGYLWKVEGKSAATIKGILAGLQSAFWDQGQSSPMQDPSTGRPLDLLARVMRGVKKATAKPKSIRLPVTVPMMRQLVAWLQGDGPTGWMRENKVMLASAWTLGLYALLRVGEFTAPTQSTHDPSTDLTRADIILSGKLAAEGQADATTRMHVHIKASKVDVFRQAVTIVCHGTGTPDDPVLWMQRYLQETSGAGIAEPLFVLKGRGYLTRQLLTQALKAGLQACGWDPKLHSSHSLRAGGAVSLSSAGFGREVIAVYGRWSSDSLELYLKLQQHSLRAAAIGMARVTEEMVERQGHGGIRRRD